MPKTQSKKGKLETGRRNRIPIPIKKPLRSSYGFFLANFFILCKLYSILIYYYILVPKYIII